MRRESSTPRRSTAKVSSAENVAREARDQFPMAQRVSRLGTETAFAVAAEAAAYAAQGHRVFPFHIGDLNFATPQNIVDASLKAIRDGKTGYCPNAGIPALRAALAAELNESHGLDYRVENIAVQPGGKPVIGKFLLALMNPGDEVLYPNPGFPIYESQIEFNGGVAVPYRYLEGEAGFEIDLDALEAAITPRTRLLILNDLQNPHGAECSVEELARIAELVERHDLMVLSDEAYFDVRYSGRSRSFASIEGMDRRTVILYTFSKKFAMTGWRLGAAIGPRRVIDVITTLNVNDESCTNHFVQYGGIEALTGDQSESRRFMTVLSERRDAALSILRETPCVRSYEPNATFYLFPNVTEAMKLKGYSDVDDFRRAVLKETGVSMCSRTHFGRTGPGETQYYVRLAYSGIENEEISEGLGILKNFLSEGT